jgi:exopolysaccharide production protein ExoQ
MNFLRTTSVAGAADETAHAVDRLTWLAALLCMIGLILILAGSSWGAVLFLTAGGLLVAARAERCLHLVLRSPGLWVLPAVAAMSALWSQAPDVTLRAAAELAATIGIASLIAGFLRPREFVSAMSVSLLVGAILSLLFGRYGVDGLSGETVFMGIFASKNTMAAFMSFLAIFAAAVLADRQQPKLQRCLALFSFVLSVPLLLRAGSAGALMTTAGSLVVLVLTVVFAHLSSRERLLVLACVAALAVPIAVITTLLALNGTLGDVWSSFLTGVLGKDATMTGRTVLWQIALGEIAKRPILGTGYYAFWLQGNLLAESIWRYFSIDSRMGFSFHDTYLEFAVELGWPGVTILAGTLVVTIERVIRLALVECSWATGALVAVVFCLVTRTIGEVDLPYPFAAPTFLLFAAAAYGADYARFMRRSTRPVPVLSAGWTLQPTELPNQGA